MLAIAVGAGALAHRARAARAHLPLAASTPTLAVAATRPVEVRLAYGAVDVHRPYDAGAQGPHRREDVPLASLAALEASGDVHGLAAGFVLAGNDERAASYLAAAPPSADVEADRAAIALDEGDVRRALTGLDAVLAAHPRHPQAAFNRAVALRRLGLSLAAAEAFDAVAERGEPGWATEAREAAAALRAEHDRRKAAWAAFQRAGNAMVQGGPLLRDAEVAELPDLARHYFYHALAAAPSLARAEALEPLAARLDAHFGGSTLADAVSRAERDDFVRRAAFGATYARAVASANALDARQTNAFLDALRSAGERDMLLGALQLAGHVDARRDEYARVAASVGDPWFIAIADRARAKAEFDAGDLPRAERTLRVAIAACDAARLSWRCATLEQDLEKLLSYETRTPEARAVALSGLARSRTAATYLVSTFIAHLLDEARLEGDVALVDAYGREEELLAPDQCEAIRDTHLERAIARIAALDADGLVRELDAASRCGRPITLLQADPMVDAVRLGRRPAGVDTLARDLTVARSGFGPGNRALGDVLLARLAFATGDDVEGERRARQALAEAARVPEPDDSARKAEQGAWLTLAVAAAQGGRADEAMAYLASGAHAGDRAARATCALGVAVDDDRALSVTRDRDGEATAELARLPSPTLTPSALVSSAARARLAGCPAVRVLALAPVHGLDHLLPPELAWAYASSPEPAPAHDSSSARPLVVSDVLPPPELGLAPLGSWGAPREGATWLHGAGATPGALLTQLVTATEVEIHAHGIVDAAQSAASIIVLSPDADGAYGLSAADLRPGSLRGHPVVVLGACHAGKTASYVHEAWSLPSAFVRAGARAVLASPSAIPDAEAHPFFGAVLERIHAGAAPAVALRDERTAWLARDRASWAADVLDFE